MRFKHWLLVEADNLKPLTQGKQKKFIAFPDGKVFYDETGGGHDAAWHDGGGRDYAQQHFPTIAQHDIQQNHILRGSIIASMIGRLVQITDEPGKNTNIIGPALQTLIQDGFIDSGAEVMTMSDGELKTVADFLKPNPKVASMSQKELSHSEREAQERSRTHAGIRSMLGDEAYQQYLANVAKKQREKVDQETPDTFIGRDPGAILRRMQHGLDPYAPSASQANKPTTPMVSQSSIWDRIKRKFGFGNKPRQ